MSVEDSIIGDVGLVSISDATGQVEPSGALIGRQITPAPGKESVAEALFSELESKVEVFGEADKMELASLARAPWRIRLAYQRERSNSPTSGGEVGKLQILGKLQEGKEHHQAAYFAKADKGHS